MSRRFGGARLSRRCPGVTAAASFSPLSLSPVLWLRADMGITLNGANVSDWADQSGTGDANKHMSQGTAANQPLYNATDAAYNNQATLQWNDNTDTLSSGLWSPPSVGTVFLVGETGGAATEIIFRDLGGFQWELYQNAALDLRFFGSADLTAVATDMTVPCMLSVDINGASSKLYQNSNTALSTGNTGSVSPAGLIIGSPLAAGAKIAEMLVFGSVLSAGSRASVSAYLGARYGITIT